ncbi:MAG: hypothetical protein JWN40_2632 [Phycisphaerales bacterium]|nr:hypothetical protein [Phycisphaerales bacterium]
MTLVSDKSGPAPAKVSVTLPQGIPQEVEFILSALEVGEHGGQSRRRLPRRIYRVAASLRLFSDPPQVPPWTLFVRDVNTQGLGFVTRHRLPLGYGGILTIASPKGRAMRIDCTLLRCREAVQGWFEGSMYFNREQGVFDLASVRSD